MLILKHKYATDQDARSQTNTPLMEIYILRHKYATDQDACSWKVAGNIVSAFIHTTSCNTQSSVLEDVQNNCPKHVELTGIINKPLLLHLVGCLYYLYQ
jgi:hypothetical protein